MKTEESEALLENRTASRMEEPSSPSLSLVGKLLRPGVQRKESISIVSGTGLANFGGHEVANLRMERSVGFLWRRNHSLNRAAMRVSPCTLVKPGLKCPRASTPNCSSRSCRHWQMLINEANSEQRVYLASGSTDLRKSIDGLAVLVQEVFQLSPFSPSLFVFCNRKRDKLKILEWDTNGFWLHYRRLERGCFQWPETMNIETVTVSRQQLRWLLDGLSIPQRQAHKKVSVRTVI